MDTPTVCCHKAKTNTINKREDGRVIRLIGISGKMASGKTTLARDIIEQFHFFTKRSFADNLREMASILSGVPVEQMRSAEHKSRLLEPLGMTVGELLQRLGTDAVRNTIHPDAWVISLFSQFTVDQSAWVIDDVRFVNEAEAIRQHGGILIRLQGDPGGTYDALMQSRDRNHPSETALDHYEHFDYVIDTGDTRIQSQLLDVIFPLVEDECQCYQ